MTLVLLASVAAGCTPSVSATDKAENASNMILAPCPKSPNCVSSDATDPKHAIVPLRFSSDSIAAWDTLREVVLVLPRTTLVAESPTHLRFEVRSAIFRFVDDLEFELRSGESEIAVRSSSRVGYSDLGVNRKRVEQVRAALVDRGIVP